MEATHKNEVVIDSPVTFSTLSEETDCDGSSEEDQ